MMFHLLHQHKLLGQIVEVHDVHMDWNQHKALILPTENFQSGEKPQAYSDGSFLFLFYLRHEVGYKILK